MVRTGKALEHLPLLSQAYEEGEISSTHVREITNSKTTKVIARKLTLTATRPAFLCCRIYGVGNRVDVFLTATVNPDEGKGTGLWLPGGYSSHWLRHRITKVNDLPSVGNIKESKSVKLMLTATRETSMKWKLYHTGTKV